MMALFKRHFPLGLGLALVIVLTGFLTKCPQQISSIKSYDHLAHDALVKDFLGTDEPPECASCHETETVGAALVAGHDVCESCHDLDMDAPDELCLKCHELPAEAGKAPDAAEWAKLTPLLAEAYKEKREARATLRGEVIFDHPTHVAHSCQECHGAVIAPGNDPALVMNTCVTCHLREDALNECETCHRELRADVQPQNHNLSWSQNHGMESHLQARNCATCHEQSYCDECHRSERPQNHNAFFRKRGHGFFAESNRRNCEACHQVDYCEQCHFEVEPLNHTMSFEQGGHCRTCHFPMTAGSKCQLCHQNSGHPPATSLGHPFNARVNCLPCHRPSGASHSLLTVRPGDCVICHSPGSPTTLTAGSPTAPHTLIGIPFNDCAVCHIFSTQAVQSEFRRKLR